MVETADSGQSFVPSSHNEQSSEPCSVCFNLKFSPQRAYRALKSGAGIPGHMDTFLRDLDDLEASGSQGCSTCDFVTKAILHFEPTEEDRESIAIHFNKYGNITILLTSTYKTIQIYTPAGQPPVLENITNSEEVSCSADSQQAYNFIKNCLARCDSHPICRPVSFEVPTRLIEVGSPQDTAVRLVETVSSSQDNYIALSYCWGKSEVVKTLQENYEDMKKGIQVRKFPRTIQDAIEITRKLGQRYLWIDAICIIQDSTPDWEIESSKMASVYSNAYLTIAAATSNSATEGFLHQKHIAVEDKAPFKMEWKTHQGQQSILAARVIPDLSKHSLSENGEAFDPLPLSLRGWTLQESSLSRRLLTYTTEELRWSCLYYSVCECTTLDKIEEKEKFLYKSLYSINSQEKAYQEWHYLVSDFMERALTKPMDRLPAISGIARVVQDVTNSKYIAGLWSENFIEGLTWTGSTIGNLTSSSSVKALPSYRAPTFSWASVEQLLSYTVTENWVSAKSCSLIEADSKVPGRNPLGQVESAWATLRGLLFKTTLQIRCNPDDDEDKEYCVPCVDTEFHLKADMALESFEAAHHGVIEKSVRRSPFGSTKKGAEAGTPVFLFYLGHWRGARHPRRNHTLQAVSAYLVLGKSPTDMDKYERLGLVSKSFMTDADIPNDSEPVESLDILKKFSEEVITLI